MRPMQPFAIVRDTSGLEPRSSMLSMLVSPHLRRPSARHLLGVWIEAELVEHLPTVLRVPDRPAGGIMIRESASLAGVWALCWCEPTGNAVAPVTRVGLVRTLLAVPRPAGSVPGVFVPVFPADAGVDEVSDEMELLRRRGSDHIIAPVFQDPVTGGLSGRSDA